MSYDVFENLYRNLERTHAIMQDKEIPIKNKRDVARKTLKYIKRTYDVFNQCDYNFEVIQWKFDNVMRMIT